MRPTRDYDLLVVGSETEGCLAAIAARRAGATVALVAPPGHLLGGLLTEGGLAFVDRDSRHLTPPSRSPHDGSFGQFLERAGVPLVALHPQTGHDTLAAMLADVGVTVLRSGWTGVRREGRQLVALVLASGEPVTAHHFLDATADGDLAEAAGLAFATGFREAGMNGMLGFSPLPVLHGVAPDAIMATARALAADAELVALRRATFGDRAFLELESGDDYLLIGPPHLGLAYQRWRAEAGDPCPYPFSADGFNVAVLGPTTTSWNGLIYFCQDPATLLRLSRSGLDAPLRVELEHFERFVRRELGWSAARLEAPRGVYVRQTRHLLDVRHRLSLREIAGGYRVSSVGTFCYWPDFRGLHAPQIPVPLTAHVILEAGLVESIDNLGIASRAGGYTPFAHSLCRLVQYNATLGTALGVAAAAGAPKLASVSSAEIRSELERQGILADDRAGLERNVTARAALEADPILKLEEVREPA